MRACAALLATIAGFAFALSCAREAAAQGCAVRARAATIRRVRVTPAEAGVAPFDVGFSDAAVTVQLIPGPGTAAVYAEGALTLVGTTGDHALSLSRAVTTPGGLAQLPAGTTVTAGRAGGRRAALGAVEVSPFVTLRAVSVPCDALELESVRRAPALLASSPPTPSGGEAPHLEPFGTHVTLRASPGGRGAALRVDVTEPGELPLTELARRGGWVRVRAAWSSGVAIEGWAREAELSPGTHWLAVQPQGGSPHAICPSRALPRARRATLAAGTVLYAERGRGEWALVRDAGAVFDVVLGGRGERWARVVGAPGLAEFDACDGLHHAWVRARAVTPLEPRAGDEELPIAY